MAITETTYKEKLEKFLPPFIVPGNIRDALLTAIARRLVELQQAIAALPDANWTGKGLLLNAAESKILYNNRRLGLTSPAGEVLLLPDGTQLIIRNEDLGINTLQAVGLPDNQTVLLLPDGLTYLSISETYSEEPPIQDKLGQRTMYWTERGTEKGIKRDLEKMFGLKFSNIFFHDYRKSGIIGDVTAFDDIQVVDCNNLIEFHTSDRGYIVHRSEDDEVIKKQIIPIDAEIIFIGE